VINSDFGNLSGMDKIDARRLGAEGRNALRKMVIRLRTRSGAPVALPRLGMIFTGIGLTMQR